MYLPGPSAFRTGRTRYVHSVAWDDWPTQLAASVKARGVSPDSTIYVLVALSPALPEHRVILTELLPGLDAMSGHQVQWIPAGVTIQGRAQITWNERVVADCLRDLAEAAGWKRPPQGAFAIITCRPVPDGSYAFDLEAYFMMRSKKLDPDTFRELITDIGQLSPSATGKIQVSAIRRRISITLNYAQLRHAAPLLERILAGIVP